MWEEYNIFDNSAIVYLKEGLLGKSITSYNDRNFEPSLYQSQQPTPNQYQPLQNYQQPPFIQQQQQRQQYNTLQPHPPLPQQQQQQSYTPPPPQKLYFELPAGLMLIAQVRVGFE